jgi:hypothetical protein
MMIGNRGRLRGLVHGDDTVALAEHDQILLGLARRIHHDLVSGTRDVAGRGSVPSDEDAPFGQRPRGVIPQSAEQRFD